MKVISWYTTMQGKVIGIVKTNSGKMYIGVANGFSEKQDAEFIATYGAKFDLKFFEDYNRAIAQYNAVVKQNKDLQTELNELKRKGEKEDGKRTNR